jgi:hypothetical protein
MHFPLDLEGQIRSKNGIFPILALDEFQKDKTDLGIMRTFSVVNGHYKCIFILKTQGVDTF